MSTLSVRLPRDIDRVMPRRNRSAWVIQAIRERLITERMRLLGESAGLHEKEELEALAEWEPATAPIEPPRQAMKKKGKR